MFKVMIFVSVARRYFKKQSVHVPPLICDDLNNLGPFVMLIGSNRSLSLQILEGGVQNSTPARQLVEAFGNCDLMASMYTDDVVWRLNRSLAPNIAGPHREPDRQPGNQLVGHGSGLVRGHPAADHRGRAAGALHRPRHVRRRRQVRLPNV